jgi:hypothetical protein
MDPNRSPQVNSSPRGGAHLTINPVAGELDDCLTVALPMSMPGRIKTCARLDFWMRELAAITLCCPAFFGLRNRRWEPGKHLL